MTRWNPKASPVKALRCVVVDRPGLEEDAVSRLLENAGHRVNAVTRTGAAAVRLVEECQPDALIIDGRLPDLDALDVAQMASAIRPDLVTVVITTNGTLSFLSAALRSGVWAVVGRHGAADRLIPALETAASGEPYLDEDLPRLV